MGVLRRICLSLSVALILGALWLPIPLSAASADLQPAQRVAGLSGPAALAYDPVRGEVFVANYADSTVRVISDINDTVVATIHVPADPFAIVYDSNKGEVFVANNGNASVSVIADANDSLVANIRVGSGPIGLAFDQARGEVFVANHNDNTVSVISDSNDSVIATIAIGVASFLGEYTPRALAYDSASGSVFVANFGNSSLSIISDSNFKVVSTSPLVPSLAAGLGKGLTEIGSQPIALVYDSAKDEVFSANLGDDSVSAISSNGTVLATVPVGSSPLALAYDAVDGEVFVATSGSNDTSVISDSSDSVIATVPSGDNPFSLAYDSGKGVVFVGDVADGSVSIIHPPSDFIATSTLAAFTVSQAASSPRASGLSQGTLAFGLIDAAIVAALATVKLIAVRRRSRPSARLPKG